MVEAEGGCEHKINTAHCKGCLVDNFQWPALVFSSIFPKFECIIHYKMIIHLPVYNDIPIIQKILSREDTIGVGLQKHMPSCTVAPKQLNTSLSLFMPWHFLCS